jgi:hypothetical protein
MEKDPSLLSPFEYSGFDESKLDRQIDQVKNKQSFSANSNLQGSILFSPKPRKFKKPFNWIRIRSFFIKHKKFKRMMEFSCHPSGVHLLRLAMFHSENGCGMCRVYVEMNLF